MSVLVPCPDCARHVRASDATCPFCSAALPADLASRAVPAATKRMSRGATYTFAVTVAVAGVAAACGGDVDHGGGASMYGTAVIVDSGLGDSGGGAPAYGHGVPVDAGPVQDGSAGDDGGAATLYGLPQLDSGTDTD